MHFELPVYHCELYAMMNKTYQFAEQKLEPWNDNGLKRSWTSDQAGDGFQTRIASLNKLEVLDKAHQEQQDGSSGQVFANATPLAYSKERHPWI